MKEFEFSTSIIIRTSNFGANAELSLLFLRFAPENVPNIFLKLCGIMF